jgi:formate-dependent nitrite reductase membrane component NrfD
MATVELTRPVELIPGRQQTLWGRPAVINFVLGGLGAGLYVTAVLASAFQSSAMVSTASWLAPALVLAGFASVAIEAGRPWRGIRVLTRIRTSWMSRELWIGGAFVALAGAEFVFPLLWNRLPAAVLAVALALAQGFILRRSRGVAAWDVPVMPLTFLLSALGSGAGLHVVLEAVGGRAPGSALLTALLILISASLFGWVTFVSWSRDETFIRATRALRDGPAVIAVVGAGHLAPFLLFAVALAVPPAAMAASALGGLLLMGGQAHAKALLVLRAGELRPITLANLRLRRRSP